MFPEMAVLETHSPFFAARDAAIIHSGATMKMTDILVDHLSDWQSLHVN